MLARFYIGELEVTPGMEYKDFTSLEYESTGKEDFYVTLKQRVETYFHNQKVIYVTSMTTLHNL
jgi:hypothetical protein